MINPWDAISGAERRDGQRTAFMGRHVSMTSTARFTAALEIQFGSEGTMPHRVCSAARPLPELDADGRRQCLSFCAWMGLSSSSIPTRRNPPESAHIHVFKAGAEAKFWLAPSVQLTRNNGFDAKALRKVTAMVADHRAQLEEAWHDYFA